MAGVARRQPFTRLILLSGGIDSTYLLAYFLRETQDTILAHHVHLINQEGRDRAEAEACAKIVDYCRTNYRDFLYTESTVDRSGFTAMGYDVITVASEGGIAASNYLLKTGHMPDFWMLGLNAEEAEALDEPIYEARAIDPATPRSQEADGGRLTYILAATAASCYPNAPPKYLRPAIKPKKELMAYMGTDLAGLCWTCRKPVHGEHGYEECGVCDTCRLTQSIKR